jgi:hypothetical protein
MAALLLAGAWLPALGACSFTAATRKASHPLAMVVEEKTCDEYTMGTGVALGRVRFNRAV